MIAVHLGGYGEEGFRIPLIHPDTMAQRDCGSNNRRIEVVTGVTIGRVAGATARSADDGPTLG
jgi:hypothetical protein